MAMRTGTAATSATPMDERDISWYQRRVDDLERQLVLTQKLAHELENNKSSSSSSSSSIPRRQSAQQQTSAASTRRQQQQPPPPSSSSSSSSLRRGRPSTSQSSSKPTGQRLVGDIRARSDAEREQYAQKGLDAIEELKFEYSRMASERHNDVNTCVKFLSSKARDFEATVLRLHDKHDRAQEQLRVETKERVRLLTEEFEVQQGPHKMALATMANYLRDLIDQRFLRIIPPSVLRDQPSSSSSSSAAAEASSSLPSSSHARVTTTKSSGDVVGESTVSVTSTPPTPPTDEGGGDGGGGGGDPKMTSADNHHNNGKNKKTPLPPPSSSSVIVPPGTSPLSTRPIWSDVVGGGGGGRAASPAAVVTGSPLRLHMSPAIRFATPPANDDAQESATHSQLPPSSSSEQRRRVASESLKPMFPHMEVDECVRVLAQHGDNVEQTMLELLKLECEQPPPPPAATASTTPRQSFSKVVSLSATQSSSSPSTPPPRNSSSSSSSSSHSRNSSNKTTVAKRFRPPASLRILVRVVMVHPNADVEFQVMVDRNGMPIDSSIAPPHIVPASALFHELDARIVTDDERARAHAFMNAVTPVITFQPLGSAGFRPMTVVPALPLKEYRIDYDHVAEEIIAVYQVDDGPIVFTAYNPMKLPASTVPIRSQYSSIAEVYTQKYDRRLSLAHIHLPDDTHTGSIRVRLHQDTGAVPVDEMAFDVNTLNVCLTDDKVTALVRRDKVGGVKKLFFIEYRIPEPGVLVTLEDMDVDADGGDSDGDGNGGGDGDGDDDRSQSEGLCLARVGRCHGTVDVQARVSPGGGGGGGGGLSSDSDDESDESGGGGGEQGFSQRSRRLSFENEVCGRKHAMGGLVEVVVMLEFGQVITPRKETTPVCRIREARSWEAQVLGIVS